MFSEPTLKILFGRASFCAYPDCVEPLIFEDRGIPTPTVQIAHIRSAKTKGPRYDPSYPKPLLNKDENLLLLCGKHHKPVDDNGSVYPVDELLEWKSRQIAASASRGLSGQQVQQIVQQVQLAFATLAEVRLSVQAVGLINIGKGLVTTPLAGLAATTLSVPDHGRYLGVRVVNEAQAPVTVDAVGIDFDIERSTTHPSYQFPLDESGWLPSRRLEGRSNASWPAHIPTVQAGVLEVAKTYRHVPRRFRPFVQPGAGDRVEGDWVSILQIPIWKPEMTEDRLQDFIATATKRGQRAAADGTA